MQERSLRKIGISIGPVVGALALCLLILIWVMQLWKAELRIPLGYGGDALFGSMLIKGIIDNGWYLQNGFVGMPTGLALYDFPMADNFHFLLIKLISLFVSDYALTLNLFFLLTFPLTTLSSLLVFRQYKLSYPTAILGALLFTFLPYHFMRGTGHLFLAAYYLIPLIVMVILWLYSEQPLLFTYDKQQSKQSLDLLSFKSLASIVICLLLASSGVYYAFFAGFFLIVAGVSAALSRKKVLHLLSSAILITVIGISVFVNIMPSIVNTAKYGENMATGQRSAIESEIYGMKITQLLLPVSGHRVPYLAKIKAQYAASAPLVTENDLVTLGVIGSLGFLIMLGWIIFRKPVAIHNNLLSRLSELNIFAVLLATIGGLGTVFAIVISPQIRAYNRISIYIAFFSLFTVVALLESLYQKYVQTKIARCLFYGFLGLILLIGILDQTTKYFVPPYELFKAEYTTNEDFIGKIEAAVPPNALLFQLPYVPFPENPPVNMMQDYEHFRGYLHSKNLHWSYGAMKGRAGDLWQKEVAAQPVNQLVNTLSLAGFSGIYLDRNGYADQGAAVEAKLSGLLNTKAIISANNRLVFFSLEEYNNRNTQKSSLRKN